MRSGEQFNIPARNERRIKRAGARGSSQSPAELWCSVVQCGAGTGVTVGPGTLALGGQTLGPDGMAPSPCP